MKEIVSKQLETEMSTSAEYMKEIVSKQLETEMSTFILIYSCFSCLDYQVLPVESRK